MTSLKFCSGLYGATGGPQPNFVVVFMERLGWPRSDVV